MSICTLIHNKTLHCFVALCIISFARVPEQTHWNSQGFRYNIWASLLCTSLRFSLPLPSCSGSVVVTAYDSESGRPGSNPEWGLIYYKASIQGSHSYASVKFHDFSMTFPWLYMPFSMTISHVWNVKYMKNVAITTTRVGTYFRYCNYFKVCPRLTKGTLSVFHSENLCQ